MKKTLIWLMVLASLCGLLSPAMAQTAFQAACDDLLTQAAEGMNLTYDVTGRSSDTKIAAIYFDLEKERVLAADATFYGAIDGVTQRQNLTLLYLCTKRYRSLAQTALKGSTEFYLVLNIDSSDQENGMITIDSDNCESILSPLKELLLKDGFSEDDPLFADEDGQASNAASGISSPAQNAGVGYADAREGFPFQGMDLKVDQAAMLEGNALTKLYSDLEITDGQFMELTFSSPDGDMELNEVKLYSNMIQLCDRSGRLTDYSQRVISYADLEDGHNKDDYCHTFRMIYRVSSTGAAQDYMLFVPGSGGPLYTFGAAFTVPARSFQWQGYTLWLGGYNNGDSADDDINAELGANEKCLELELSAAGNELVPDTQKFKTLKVADAQGTLYPLQYTIAYKSDNVVLDSGTYRMGVHLIYYVPKDSAFADFTLITEDGAVSLPVVPETGAAAGASPAEYAGLSAYASAGDGFQWKGHELVLTNAALQEGDELAKLRDTFETEDAQFITLSFSSPEGDIPMTDYDTYARMICLCDRTGSLYTLCQRSANFAGIDESHSTDDYCRTFSITFCLSAQAQLNDYVMFVPGSSDATLYTYGASFTVPDRRIHWLDHILWLAGCNNGDSMDEGDEKDLESGEKFLELNLVCCSDSMFPRDESFKDMKLMNASGDTYGVRSTVSYQRDTVTVDGQDMLMGIRAVFHVPENSGFSDYTLTSKADDSQWSLPVAAE